MPRISVFALCFLLICSSCEKNVSIRLHPATADLVVDASIENSEYPVVFLSRSLDYFNQVDPAILSASFVHHAEVIMSNGQVSARLQEDSIRNDSSNLVIYFYSFNRNDTATRFLGELNHDYSLEIRIDGQTYTATTHIPFIRKTIDSIWWEPAPRSEDSGKAIVKARIIDPAGFGDYTRYYTSVNFGPFYPGLQSVYDDQITDGTVYVVTVDRGVNRNLSIDLNDYAFFSRGDTVTVKLANIDKATYDFWRTMEYNFQSIGNPFSSPVHVMSNISNNALGYFGGYAAQYATVIIPE
jgi:hypothetical protein